MKRRTLLTGGLALGLLAGCGQRSSASPSPSSERQLWPRTIDHAGRKVQIKAAPQKIVGMTTDCTDLGLLMVGASRFVVVPASSAMPGGGIAVDEAKKVGKKLPAGTSPNVEQLLSYGPDLVIGTARHKGEQTAAEQLAKSGVPMVTFINDDFTTPEAIGTTMTMVGTILGAEAEATKLRDSFLNQITVIDNEVKKRPPVTVRVLCLMARGNVVRVLDESSTMGHLVKRVGAANAAVEAQISSAKAIDAELLVKANPDVILLEDFRALGLKPFEGLLKNPAVAQVPAISKNAITLLPMTEVSALSGPNLAAGYRTIADRLRPA